LEHVSTATDLTEEELHTVTWFLGNAYRNVSVHAAKNLQSTVTAKNAINLLLKELIYIRFDQDLPQRENWQTEDRIRQTTDRSQKWSFILCGLVTVAFSMLSLLVDAKCYSKTVLQIIVVSPGEYPINRFIWSGTQ
jgi:hypothetical protein